MLAAAILECNVTWWRSRERGRRLYRIDESALIRRTL